MYELTGTAGLTGDVRRLWGQTRQRSASRATSSLGAPEQDSSWVADYIPAYQRVDLTGHAESTWHVGSSQERRGTGLPALRE